jgi:chemotaxis protein MotB
VGWGSPARGAGPEMERRPPDTGEAWLLSYADLITNLLIFFLVLLSAATISESRMQTISKYLSGQESPHSLERIEEELRKQVREHGLEMLIATDKTDEGLEVSLNSGLVFDTGDAAIRPEQMKAVDTMLETLVPYADKYRFAVEGHTDSQPITPGGRYASNWELSTARANAVRHRLQLLGVAPTRVRVEGYADTKPLPEDKLDGLSEAERLARHRRVVVRIY